VLQKQKRDLTLSDVVHDGPPVNVLLPRNPRSQDSQVHLRNALSIAENNFAVKSNRGNRKSPYFRAFSGFLYWNWIKNFSFLLSPKTWFEPIGFPGSLAVLIGAASPQILNFFAGGLPRRRRRRNAFELIQEYCTIVDTRSELRITIG